MTRGCQYKDPNWLNGTLDFGLWTAKLDGLGLDKEIVLRFVDLAMTIITEQNFMIKD